MIIAYLLKELKWPLEKAIWFTKSKRRWVNPNPGFVKALIALEL